MSVLAQHVDDPQGVRHRLALLDPKRLRCHDCCRTLVLPSTDPSTSTSSSSPTHTPLRAHDPRQCPRHLGELAGACRACRSEAVADEGRTRPPSPSTEAGRAAARALADQLLATRTRPAEEHA